MHKQVQHILAHLVMVLVQELVHLKRRLAGLWPVPLTHTCLQPGCSKGSFPVFCEPLSSTRLLSAFRPRMRNGLSPLAWPLPSHCTLLTLPGRATIQTGPHFLLPILQMRKKRPKRKRRKLEILCHALDNRDHTKALPVTGTPSNLP